MATNKTLAPTNVTIAIPAMADKPDASVFSNCIEKTADAVNTVNSNMHKNIDVSSLSNLEARILEVCGAMSDSSTCTGYARINFTDQSIGLNGSPATVTYSRRGSGIYIVNILQAAGVMVSDYYYNNEHHWGSLKQDVDTLNSNVANYYFGTKTLTEFQSELITYCESLPIRTYKHISVDISTVASPFLATTYIGTVEKLGSSTRLVVTLRNAYEVSPGDVEMTYKDGEWTISSLANRLGTYVIGTNTLGNIQSLLVSYAQSMRDYETKNIAFVLSEASTPLLKAKYVGTLTRAEASRLIVNVQETATGQPNNICGIYMSNTWAWGKYSFA